MVSCHELSQSIDLQFIKRLQIICWPRVTEEKSHKLYLRVYHNYHFMNAIKIGICTAFAIIVIQCMSLFLVYDFFTIDVYATIIAVTFLLIGYFLVPIKTDHFKEDLTQNLTGRELSVFRLLAEGKTNKEIAVIMTVEVSTIKTHTNNLYAKIGCKNRSDARNLWMRSQLPRSF